MDMVSFHNVHETCRCLLWAHKYEARWVDIWYLSSFRSSFRSSDQLRTQQSPVSFSADFSPLLNIPATVGARLKVVLVGTHLQSVTRQTFACLLWDTTARHVRLLSLSQTESCDVASVWSCVGHPRPPPSWPSAATRTNVIGNAFVSPASGGQTSRFKPYQWGYGSGCLQWETHILLHTNSICSGI